MMVLFHCTAIDHLVNDQLYFMHFDFLTPVMLYLLVFLSAFLCVPDSLTEACTWKVSGGGGSPEK